MDDVILSISSKLWELDLDGEHYDSFGVLYHTLGSLAREYERAEAELIELAYGFMCCGNSTYDFWNYGYTKRSLFWALYNAKLYNILYSCGEQCKWDYCYDLKELCINSMVEDLIEES